MTKTGRRSENNNKSKDSKNYSASRIHTNYSHWVTLKHFNNKYSYTHCPEHAHRQFEQCCHLLAELDGRSAAPRVGEMVLFSEQGPAAFLSNQLIR